MAQYKRTHYQEEERLVIYLVFRELIMEKRKFKMFDPALCRADENTPDPEVDISTVAGWAWFYNAAIIKK